MVTRDNQTRYRGRFGFPVLLGLGALGILGAACGSSPSGSHSTTTTGASIGPTTTQGPNGGTGAGNIAAFCRVYKNVLGGHNVQMSFQGTAQNPAVVVNGSSSLSGAPVKTAEQDQQELVSAIAADAPGLDVEQLQPVLTAYDGLLRLIRQDDYKLAVVNKDKSLPQLIQPLVAPTNIEETTLGTLSDRCSG